MDILRTLVEKYLKYHSDLYNKWPSEREWQTGLVLGTVLEGIVNYNHDKGRVNNVGINVEPTIFIDVCLCLAATRTEACLCLVNYFKSLKKRNSLEKLWAQESLQHCFYGPVVNMRELILSHLELTKEDAKEEAKEHLPITRSMDHLQQKYMKELPTNSLRFIGVLNGKGCFSATFRGENATIKILESSKG